MRDLWQNKTYNTFLAIMVIVLMGMLIIYPQTTFEGATQGMESWLKIVFPSLLPFFIGAEIMISIGVVDFMSVLLSPIMKPLFGCSGSSSFVWAMSATSGYPTSARLISSLMKQNKVDKIEAQKILSFASTSGPLFMLGAVGIGMLNSPKAGRIIAISHYVSAFIIGLFFKYYGGYSKCYKNIQPKNTHILQKALDNMSRARQNDNRGFGQILGDSIKSSFETLTMVGGFLILFSALIHLLLSSKIMGLFPNESLIAGIVSGMLEMTTGSLIISQSSASISAKIAGICFVIGWSGLSVHCQVISLLSKTNISIGLYMITKLLHGIISAIVGWLITTLFYVGDITAFNPSSPKEVISFNFVSRYSLKLFLLTILTWISIGIFISIFNRRIFYKR